MKIVPILLIRGRGRWRTMSSYPVSSRPGLALSLLPLDESNECDTRLLTPALCREGGLGCGQLEARPSQQFFLTVCPSMTPWWEWAVRGFTVTIFMLKDTSKVLKGGLVSTLLALKNRRPEFDSEKHAKMPGRVLCYTFASQLLRRQRGQVPEAHRAGYSRL